MKHFLIAAAYSAVVIFTPAVVSAQGNDATAMAAAPDQEQATLDKHMKPILKALQLDDPAKETQLRGILTEQFKALRDWHAENDARVKPLWNEFNKARSAKNAAGADAALAKIDGVYASFKPQHEKFLAELGAVLSPEQVEKVKDVLTVNKVKVTYGVYLQIFPTLTEAQKAVVLQDLKSAREQAIDCESMNEKSAFFKKYKIIIEDHYLTGEGYDPQQARKEFAAKQKALAAAKKKAAGE